MAIALNVSSLMKIVSCNAVQNNPSIDNSSVHLLIMYRNNDAAHNDTFDGTAILQEDPKISCKFCFNKSDGIYLNGNVSFTGETLNIQYDISLYCINSKFEVEFLETLNASDITSLSTFGFAKRFKFFEFDLYSTLNSLKDIKGHLVLYLKITKKHFLPIKLEIPKNGILTQFASLYNDNLLTDFKIICEDKEFLVHKVVLAATSPIFRVMIQNKMKESQENTLQISDFKQNIVEEMIHYIYTDEINADLIEEEELQKLLKIADKYELEKLKILCMQKIAESVDSFNKALDLISVGDTYNVEGCKEAILQFIKDNKRFL